MSGASAVGTYPGSCLLPGNHSCLEPERHCQWRRKSCRHLMETHRNAAFTKKLKLDRGEDREGRVRNEVTQLSKEQKAVDVGKKKKGDKERNISENNDCLRCGLWLPDYDMTRIARKWGNQTVRWQKNHKRVWEVCVLSEATAGLIDKHWQRWRCSNSNKETLLHT